MWLQPVSRTIRIRHPSHCFVVRRIRSGTFSTRADGGATASFHDAISAGDRSSATCDQASSFPIEQRGSSFLWFMYCEEIEWSMRIRAAGWEIYTVPNAHVTHLAGQSTKQIRPQSVINLWKSRMQLFEKHYSPLKLWLARRIIRLGMHRQIRLAQRAYEAGDYSVEEREPLIEAYQIVQKL